MDELAAEVSVDFEGGKGVVGRIGQMSLMYPAGMV